jgi:hypothetical protein
VMSLTPSCQRHSANPIVVDRKNLNVVRAP